MLNTNCLSVHTSVCPVCGDCLLVCRFVCVLFKRIDWGNIYNGSISGVVWRAVVCGGVGVVCGGVGWGG